MYHRRVASPLRAFTATLIASALYSAGIHAYQPTTILGQMGRTDLEQRTGDAVQTVCGQLGLITRTALQNDLFDRCGNMVGNASAILAAGHPAQPKSLGWTTEAEVAAMVLTVANEELAATKSMATELSAGQATSAFARLGAVRGGARFGALQSGADAFGQIADNELPQNLGGALGGAAGDTLGGAWGFFANANYRTGERDGTDREDEFDYDSKGVTVGADYRLDDNTVVGGLFSFDRLDADFDDNSNFINSPSGSPGGSIDADSWGIGVYGTYYQDNYYLDGMLGYTYTEYDLKREILLPLGAPSVNPAAVTTSRTAKGDTDANSWTLAIGGGMDMHSGSLTYGPYARFTYQKTSVDGYRESGALGLNLTVDDQDWDSITTTIGGQASYAMSQDWGILTPYGRLAWVHEFGNDSETMRAFYTVDPNRNNLIAETDDPDRNYAELNVGVSAVMRDGVQAFFDYQTLLGHSYVDDHVFTAGFRVEM